jgi:mannosylglycerate hydrolase
MVSVRSRLPKELGRPASVSIAPASGPDRAAQRIAEIEARFADRLSREAASVLVRNDVGFAVKPSPRLYPHQWNWDSGFIAIALALFDETRAERELMSLLDAQWNNGMVPHIVFNPDAKDYAPGPEFWRTDLAAHAPIVRGRRKATSGHTQPPVLASAARRVYERAGDRGSALRFLARAYPKLLRAHDFLRTQRDASGEGIFYAIHPWETGRDDAPEWLALMARISLGARPEYRRHDTSIVDPCERPTDAEYDRYAHLVEVFRGARWEETLIRERSPFLVEDVLMNALAFEDAQDLAWIARELRKEARSNARRRALDRDLSRIEAGIERTRASFSRRFWNEERGLFFSFDLRGKRSIEINTAATFLPLYAGLATRAQAKRLVEEHLLNPDEYRIDHPLPSTSRSETRYFDPKRYWLGPAWINLNWMVIRGLRRYGYEARASELSNATIELVRRRGFYEYYDAGTGEGRGTGDFSWSAALALDLLHGGAGSDDRPMTGEVEDRRDSWDARGPSDLSHPPIVGGRREYRQNSATARISSR